MASEIPRVRFAPSPTGYLHVGGARTALFNWLYAKRHGGTLILRIEDTDLARSSDEMVRAIYEGLAWLGLDPDEGPFMQTASRQQHVERARAMEASGAAYVCFCTPQELEARKEAVTARGGVWKYDRRCAGLGRDAARARASAGEPHCLRFSVPEGRAAWDDLVHGPTSFENADIEDLVMLRADGSPTYNLSCVSDDLDMRITHVIRGDDHISNTPKQILLYGALGAAPPRFGHLPLILGDDRKRLSKRHGAVAVTDYREQGYLPEALFNFLALLGWSPGKDRELMTREEMVAWFSFEGVSSRSAVFDHDKLAWMNGEYLKRLKPSELVALVRPFLEREGLWRDDLAACRGEWLEKLLALLLERSRLVTDLARDARPFLTEKFDYDPAAVSKQLRGPQVAQRLRSLGKALSGLATFDEAGAETTLRGLAAAQGIKAGDLIHPARVALTGRMVSPGIFAVMSLMGLPGVLARLERGAAEAEAQPAGAPETTSEGVR